MIERNEEQQVKDQHTEKALRQQRTIFNKETEKRDWWLETPESVIVIIRSDFVNEVQYLEDKVGDDTVSLMLFDEQICDNWGYAPTGSTRDAQGIVTNFILDGNAGSSDLGNFRFNKMDKDDIRSSEITVKDYLLVNRTALHHYYNIMADLKPILDDWDKVEAKEEYKYKEVF